MGGHGNNKQKPRREGFDPLPVGSERIYQKNEGDWAFTLGESDDGKAVLLDVDIGKYIDISLVDVDVQPLLVRMLCKGRLLQLELFEEVNPDKSNAQRSKTTGHLVITMPKVRASCAVHALASCIMTRQASYVVHASCMHGAASHACPREGSCLGLCLGVSTAQPGTPPSSCCEVASLR